MLRYHRGEHGNGSCPEERRIASMRVTTTTIIIADDHSLIRSALAGLLNDIPNFDVVAEVGSADDALTATAKLRPSVVVLDIEMPGIDAFQAAAEVKTDLSKYGGRFS